MKAGIKFANKRTKQNMKIQINDMATYKNSHFEM
jgi:hypothetical protein